jgi:two-component system, NarL family, invasion response regulator UvrY
MITLFVVDDHHIFREGVKKIIADTEDMVVVGEACDGRQALRGIAGSGCNVVLLDLALQGMDGLDVLRDLRISKPDQAVLILTMYPEEHYGVRAFQAGASGYLTKDSIASDLLLAIRKVAHGGRYVSSTLGERLARELSKKGEEDLHEALSHREYEIFLMTASGKSVKEIAQELALARTTVSSYRSRILEKLKIRNTAELVRYAVERRLIRSVHMSTDV